MPLVFTRDRTTGVVAVDADALLDMADAHDSFSRFYVPSGKAFRVLFECGGLTTVAARGDIVAGRNKMRPVRIKVRIEPECAEPQDPALEDKI